MRLRRRTLNTLLMILAGVICTTLIILIIAFLRPAKHKPIIPPPRQLLNPIVLDYYTGTINGQDIERLKLDPNYYLDKAWDVRAIARVRELVVNDPASVKALFAYQARKKAAEDAAAAAAADPKRKRDKDKEPVFDELPPKIGKSSIYNLVESRFIERELDMEFLSLQPGLFGSPWRAQHLDRDPATTDPAAQKADPYFEVSLVYRDGQASLGPVWVVNVETGAVIPRNDFARLFDLSPDRPNQVEDFRQDLTKVVKLLSNHQFDSGLQLGGFLLQNFVTRNQACRDAQARKLQDASGQPITCDNDGIIGWTVNHLLDDPETGREYLAYFQWRENNRLLTARWQVVLKDTSADSGAPPFSFRPIGLLSMDLMKQAETYCPGDNPTESADDRLTRLTGYDLYTSDGKPILSDAPRVEWRDVCRKSIDLAECSPGIFTMGDTCDPEQHPACCKVTEPGKRIEVTVNAQNPDSLKRLYSAIKARQTGKLAQDIFVAKKELSARQGPLWPEDYDTNFDIWRDGSRTATLMTDNPAAKPILSAFALTLREGDFVMAVQDLLATQGEFLIEKADCAAAELALQAKVRASAAPDADGDGDGVPDATDNCLSVANADQRDGFSHEKNATPGQGNGVGDTCDCRWAPSRVPLSPEEEAQPRTHDAFRVAYQYRQGDEVKTVGFFILNPAAPAAPAADDKKDKDKEPPAASPAPQGRAEIIPIDQLSEWAFWSVNPRNLKGGQDKARKRLPTAAATE
jgi:hypothetical protein